LRGERHYRLILVLKNVPEAPQNQEVSFEELRSQVEYLSAGRIKIESSNWLSRFRVSHRMVERFQKGRVFLAGDAAHIHSPAGGQGMNTGIQDALNLGFKLNAVFLGASPSHLYDYEDERIPVARGILRATDFFSRLMLLPENPLMGFLRRQIMPLLAGRGWLQKKIVTSISQVKIARREIRGYK
jgi:2-polyprenyl-6-methoxyphenol hydroxylase-like FAD-dependent oxidoreductase